MTISSTSSRVVYSGDGATSSFGFAFYVSDQGDLVVTYTDAAGNQTVVAPGSTPAGYQISAPAVPAPGWPTGGTITYNPGSPIAVGSTLTIQRIVAGTQPTTLSNQGAFWPQVIEKALDRLVTIVQGFIDQVNRSLQAPATDPVTLNPLPTAAARKNTVLGFDNNGQPYPAVITGSLVSVNAWLVSNFLGAASSAAAACSALGAFFLGGNNTASGSNSFTGTNDFTAGRIKVPTRSAADNGTDAASTAYADRAAAAYVVRSYLAGLALSTAGGSSSFGVAAGAAANSTGAAMMALASAYTKTTAAWAVGSGNGALDTGAIANGTWYHVHLIERPDTGVVDLLLSLSATTPTLPANYTLFRRLGSLLTDGSAHFVAFSQLGDEFLWKTAPALDVSAANPGTAAVTRTLTVPSGVQVTALMNVGIAGGAGGPIQVLISSLDANDQAPSQTASPGGQLTLIAGSTVPWAAIAPRTNTSGQVRSRLSFSDGSTTLYISTQGWIDRRGREN